MKIKYEEITLSVELMGHDDCVIELFKACKKQSSKLFAFELIDMAKMNCAWSDFIAYVIYKPETEGMLELCFLSNNNDKLSGVSFSLINFHMHKDWILDGDRETGCIDFFNFTLGIATSLLGRVDR